MTTTVIMSAPRTAERAQWQQARMPRLSYRNAVPQEEEDTSDEEETTPSIILTTSSANPKANTPGRSIKEIREAIAESQSTVSSLQQSQQTVPAAQATKGKRSLFGSLFQKEPTISAFEQYGQSMIAQHGSLSPKNIPNVSAEKMPSSVPKVNSKWHGVPDYVKLREDEERERAKARNRISKSMNSNVRCTDPYEERLSGQRRNSNTASMMESWDSSSMNSRPYYQENLSMRPGSIYSTSSGGSTPSANRPTWEKAYSYTSSTGPKSSDNSLGYYKDTASTPKAFQGLLSSQSVSTQSSYSDQSRPDLSPSLTGSAIDAMPGYTSSAVTTPVECSPQTPSPFSENDLGLDGLLIHGDTSSIAAASAGRNTDQTSKNSNSKQALRAGLKLRTNSSVAPWESQLPPSAGSTHLQPVPTPTSPRGKIRVFGREKK